MTTETKISEAEKERIRQMVADARARAARYRKEHPGEPFPFMKYAGAWKGANFTDEEIEAAKIRSRDLAD
jgi:hypothetical protein